MLPDLPGWDSLSAVTRYHGWAEVAGIVFLAALVIAEVVTYQYGHRKDDLTEKQQTATDQCHDEQMARLHVEASNANKRTEELRADNNAIQEAIQPRRLGSLIAITSPDAPDVPPAAEMQFGGIRQYAGTTVLIQVVNDFEAQILANDVQSVTSAFGWNAKATSSSFTHIPTGMILEGVSIWYPTSSNLKAAADALAAGFTKAKIVGETSVLRGGS